ncbi:hypothetical protein [Ornithinimicrobium sufpigmenti]|uniref:hypothetical protein n=1 Tax=Ornithinimicrobium sufpigmenti TaxID=2508882 RepID=UPI0011AE2AE3|nr:MULTISPECIES: hypothetical protein [unclassified Ornithinimicrobium]
MRHHDPPGTPRPTLDEPPPVLPSPDHAGQGYQHGQLMWLMCVPMLALVGVLIATGAWGTGGVVYALACVAMMVGLMLWMRHGSGPRGR